MQAGLRDEVFDWRPIHRLVQPAADEQDGVAHSLGVQPASVHPPEQSIVGVFCGGGFIVHDALTVSAAGDDQTVQFLQRAAAVAESAASQSSSSGCDGTPPILPKSFGVSTIPLPKW